jgi:hypothetical protein
MKLKIVVALSLLAVAPGIAYAQKDAPAAAPKPTLADVQKVVTAIGADKTKLQQWCDIGKLQQQMAVADQKKDQKALESLGSQADALAEKIGPDFTKLMDGLDQVDPDSPDGKKYDALFGTLAKQCK